VGPRETHQAHGRAQLDGPRVLFTGDGHRLQEVALGCVNRGGVTLQQQLALEAIQLCLIPPLLCGANDRQRLIHHLQSLRRGARRRATPRPAGPGCAAASAGHRWSARLPVPGRTCRIASSSSDCATRAHPRRIVPIVWYRTRPCSVDRAMTASAYSQRQLAFPAELVEDRGKPERVRQAVRFRQLAGLAHGLLHADERLIGPAAEPERPGGETPHRHARTQRVQERVIAVLVGPCRAPSPSRSAPRREGSRLDA
jgi:hypothetical protein